MSVDVESTAGRDRTAVDRSPSARVVALRPRVGRHTAAGPSPEVVALVPDPGHATVPAHPARHQRGGGTALVGSSRTSSAGSTSTGRPRSCARS
ncbi:hypothetical protein ASD18_07635 [Cellulomonas sp. Root137]|nr:hypothetical protein ASD18_07635 [Cellulomonas sp. Root137]